MSASTTTVSTTHETMLRTILSEVSEKLTLDLQEVLSKTLEKQLTEALTQAMLDSEVYRRISNDMRSGLQRIYKEISATAVVKQDQQDVGEKAEHTNKLFYEASKQLSTVLSQTEQATVAILEVVERHMDLQVESEKLLTNIHEGKATEADSARLMEINSKLGEDLNTIMLSLSFQDLTGQRIKRAVSALKEIESTVVELYLSTGLLLQAYEEDPDKPLEQIEAEAKQKIMDFKGTSILDSELKGPTQASQKNIDDLLSQLGM